MGLASIRMISLANSKVTINDNKVLVVITILLDKQPTTVTTSMRMTMPVQIVPLTHGTNQVEDVDVETSDQVELPAEAVEAELVEATIREMRPHTHTSKTARMTKVVLVVITLAHKMTTTPLLP